MKRILFLLFFIGVLSLTAVTEIPAGDVSGIWTQAGSPYHIMGNITVPENEILNIDSGCEVIFQGHYNISVNGAISAFGTEADSIRFSAANSDLGWKGFDLFYAEDDTEVISSIFQYCVFENAIGNGGYWDKKGGAISLKYGNQLILQNCRFSSNEADYGGAIYAKYADLIIDNCLFENNKANNDAGAVYLSALTIALISNSSFRQNECNYDGGAVYVVGEADATFNYCLFESNRCFDYLDGSGGGVSVWGSNAEFNECEFSRNLARGDSGGLELAYEASGIVNNCIFTNNTTGYSGGGINVYRSEMEISNSLLAFNQSETGGGLRIGYESTVTFSETDRSSIYLNHTTNNRVGCDISISSGNEVNILLSKFTVLDPDEEYIFSYHEYDFEALGAIVTPTSEDIYVSIDGDILNSGLTPEDPVPTINMALKMCNPGTGFQTIHVAGGFYDNLHNETFPVNMKENVHVLGEGSETTFLQGGQVANLINAEEETGWKISGFTLSYASNNGNDAVKIVGATGVLEDLNISDIVLSNWSYLVNIYNTSTIDMIDVEINNNKILNGSALRIVGSNVNLSGCTISNNHSMDSIAGIIINDSEVTFSSEILNSIYNNTNTSEHPKDLGVFDCSISAVMDTFTVMNPTEYFAAPSNLIDLSVNNAYIQQQEGEVFVALDGDDSNTGSSEDAPLKTITMAMSVLNTENEPGTIHLGSGLYQAGDLGYLPLAIPNDVTILGFEDNHPIIQNSSMNGIFKLSGNITALKNIIMEDCAVTPLSVLCNDFLLENIQVRNCDFLNNIDPVGMYSNPVSISNASGIIKNCKIYNNNIGSWSSALSVYNSNITLSGGSIHSNRSESDEAGALYHSNGTISFDPEDRISIYNNSSRGYGSDIYFATSEFIDIYLDTASVAILDPLFIKLNNCGNLDVNQVVINQVDGSVYVSPEGSDDNSGLSAEEPIRTMSYANKLIKYNQGNTVHLAEGSYIADDEGESFPILLRDGVNWQGAGINSSIVDGNGEKNIFMGSSNVWNTFINNVTISKMKIQYGNDYSTTYPYYNEGGAVRLYSCNANFSDVMFYNNSANIGSSIFSSNSTSVFDDCVFYNNQQKSGSYNGSVVAFRDYSDVVMKNSTFVENDLGENQIVYLRDSKLALVNSILWDDIGKQIYMYEYYQDASELVVSNSCLRGGEESIFHLEGADITWAEGNIEDDPLLQYTWQLDENSPCIDAGTSSFSWDGSLIFEMQEDEYAGDAPDMGAYEYGMTDFETVEVVPLVYNLKQNYPNPFNPETTISYSIPKDGNVSLEIYNIKGQKVRSLVKEKKEAGSYEVVWSGTDDDNHKTASGIYFYKIKAGKFERLKKMVLLK